LPSLAPGAPCPASGVSRFPFARYGVRPGIGPGPAYPIGFEQPGSVLRFQDPAPPGSSVAGSPWNGQKVLWFVAPRYRGPVLVRGRRLDTPDVLRFDRGRLPAAELRIQPAGTNGYARTGPRGRASLTRFRTAGCYAYQIDGTTFSRVIVFETKPYA
jgi:hypothetical protein